MSATDEEMLFANSGGMDHVTYVLIFLSLAFALYTFVLVLLHTWAFSGRNAPSSGSVSGIGSGLRLRGSASSSRRDSEGEEGVELDKWYQRVPNTAAGLAETDAEEDGREDGAGECAIRPAPMPMPGRCGEGPVSE